MLASILRRAALLVCLATVAACSDGASDPPGDAPSPADAAADAAARDAQPEPDVGPVADTGLEPDAIATDAALDAQPEDAGTPTDAAPPVDAATPACDPIEVLASNGCSTGGCHAAPVQGGLDLSGPADVIAARLVGAVSTTDGCGGRLLIDPWRPEHSLMLQAIGTVPPLGGDLDTCQTVMPPGGQLSAEDADCLATWVRELAADAEVDPLPAFEPVPLAAALRKVKTLVVGAAPTPDELAAVDADPAALRGLVEGWVGSPAFEPKLADFLLVALQQRLQVENDVQFNRLQRARVFNPLVRRVLEETFVRTAMGLIAEGRPLTEIATTRRFMVTTANLVLLRYPDRTAAERGERHTLHPNAEDAPPNLRQQIAQRSWHTPGLPGRCELTSNDMLDALFGFVRARRRCENSARNNYQLPGILLTEADFEDWRWVTFVPADEAPDLPVTPFYDLRTLRTAERLSTRLPRVGFFTTSVFLENWATNDDNQYRVHTNQSLLTALNIGFVASEPTVPPTLPGLDPAHAEAGTACYGCHKQLDPIRLYTAHAFDVSYQLPAEGTRIYPDAEPAFGFRGHTAQGGDMYRFGELLAEHPRFGLAWAQKLCLWANSERCNERDPAFLAIVTRFAESGHDFNTLLIDLLSSPLVTGLEPTDTWRGRDPTISVTRSNHLCALLAARLDQDVCSVNRVRQVIGLIPRDDFARGAADPTQPARTSAFQFAAAEAVCEAVALTVVNGASATFPPRDPETAVANMVGQVMALPEGHPRRAQAIAVLTAHYDAAREAGQNFANAARAAFALACLSPDVMGVGL